VRIAWSGDADAVARCQVRGWRDAYASVLPGDVLAELDPDEFAAKWRASLDKPVDARNRVLVALERSAVRGFAVTSPAADPDCDPIVDGEITEFVIDPDHRREGHGSRLLQACTDTLRADQFTRAVWWLPVQDDPLREFVTSTGWAADGAHRELDLAGDGQVRLKQVRLHTSL